jgi:hypothetical protein
MHSRPWHGSGERKTPGQDDECAEASREKLELLKLNDSVPF